MSRNPRPDVWEQTFPGQNTGLCPCCRSDVPLHKNKSTGIHGWQRGHIIADNDGGRDYLVNFRAICLDCNRGDIGHKSNYHYSAWLRVITYEEAENSYLKLKEMCSRIDKDLSLTKCIAEGCKPHKRKANSPFCKVCGRNANINLERYAFKTDSLYLNWAHTTLVALKSISDNTDDHLFEVASLKLLISEMEAFRKKQRRY